MLQLYISNRIEKLSQEFAEQIKKQSDCFASELIVMQTSGMERWLSLETAKHNGIFANFQFIKPNSFINQLYKLADIEADSLYNTENLKWILYRFLDDEGFKKEFEQVAQYYQNDDIKRLQLSVKIADLFDQYLLYRQDYIEAWNQGKFAKVTRHQDDTDTQVKHKQERLDKHQKWQFALWKLIKDDLSEQSYDKVQLRDLLIQKLNEPSFRSEIKEKYGKISLFGLSVITDYHIEIFHRLSDFMDVNLYFLNPAPETYWYDIVSEKFVYYIEKKTGQSIEALKLHVGNELLSNYSALAKDTYNILFKSDDFVNAIDDSLTEGPENNSLLEKIQHDIFNNLNKDRNPITIEDLKDQSFLISSSYTPMREVEALYNQLLYYFDQDQELRPQDIIIQLSDVDLYTPYIRAVFDNAKHRIPYTIADRSYAGGDTLVGILEILLQLSFEDFTSEKVMQLLNSEFIRNRFGITNLDLIRDVVREANIRFGIKGYADDDTRYVSWTYGLERILLGYAIKGADEYDLEDYSTYPLDTIEGSDAEELLRFKAFVDQLISSINQRLHDRPLNEWKAYIENLLEALISSDEKSDAEVKYIQQHLLSIDNMVEWLKEDISYEVFQKSFIDALFSNPRAGNFITGGITFCSMIPMRSIPFKVTAMLGLNGDKFPRKDTNIAFNLIDVEYKRGDRNAKNNDKYLFLETILSARKHLYISYIGNSTKDNSEFPPSLLVEELKHYIERGCSELNENQKINQYLVQKHPLHAFSKKYFDRDSNLFSYNSQGETPFTAKDVSQNSENAIEIKKISIQELAKFFENPFQYYYNKVLQIYYQEDQTLLPESEIFEPDALEKYFLKSDLFSMDQDLNKYTIKQKKIGNLPLANMAPIAVNLAQEEIINIKNQYVSLIKDIEAKTIHTEFEFYDIKLQASIFPIFDGQQIVSNVSGSSSKSKYLIRAWLKHLAIMASGQKVDTLFIANYYETPMVWPHNMIQQEDAQHILKQCVAFYLQGQKKALAFMPLQGFNLAQSLIKNWGHKEKEIKALIKGIKDIKKLESRDMQTGMIDLYVKRESEQGFFDEQEKYQELIQEEMKNISLLLFSDLIKSGKC